eukprot:11898003-Alexandrium_andersonii.AAC.1
MRVVDTTMGVYRSCSRIVEEEGGNHDPDNVRAAIDYCKAFAKLGPLDSVRPDEEAHAEKEPQAELTLYPNSKLAALERRSAFCADTAADQQAPQGPCPSLGISGQRGLFRLQP